MNAVKDREVRILDIISVQKSIKVNLLAEILEVTDVTLRRDLDKLEKKGIILRTHGYATLDGADITGKRMAINYLIKKRIAEAAAQIVEEGEKVMVESGSCCAIFAEELALMKKNVTIITNSFFIANYLSRMQDVKITLLGGCFQPESQVMIGPMTKKCANEVYSQKYFLGTDGFSPEYGFTGRDYLRAETACELANHAEKVFIITEAAKFFHRGAYNLINLDKLTGVFTDDGIPKEAEAVLIKNGVQLHKVPAAEEKIRWRKFPGHPPLLLKE